jgi:molecular chaperone GrpE
MDQNKELENEHIAAENNEQEQEEVTASQSNEEGNAEQANREAEEEAGNTAVAKLEQELAEQKDKYLRMYSEFENFRRRTAKEKLDMIKTANESMATALLPVLDDFERALKSIEDAGEQAQEGILLIYNKLKKVLEQKGVTMMDIKPGDEFDAEFQEAITQIPAPEDKLKGKVVDVVEKGYMLGEKVIRFAKVVIGA